MGEIKDDHEQQKQWAARRESGRRRKADMECHSCNQKGHFVREEERQLVEDMLAIGIIQEKTHDVLISQSNVCLSLVGPIKGHVWGNKARVA